MTHERKCELHELWQEMCIFRKKNGGRLAFFLSQADWLDMLDWTYSSESALWSSEWRSFGLQELGGNSGRVYEDPSLEKGEFRVAFFRRQNVWKRLAAFFGRRKRNEQY